MKTTHIKLMKSLIVLSTIAFIMLLPTCGKDKSSNNKDTEQLLEEWDGKSDWAQSKWAIQEDPLPQD